MKNIKELSVTDRPREKMLLQGPGALSEIELLAILLGFGTKDHPVIQLCTRLLKNGIEDLAAQSLDDISKIKGIGHAKAAIILAAVELGKRQQAPKIPKIKSNTDALKLLAPHFKNVQGRLFILVLLNRQYELLATCELQTDLPEIGHILELVREAGAQGFGLVRNRVKETAGFLTRESKMLTDLEAAATMLRLKYLGRVLLE